MQRLKVVFEILERVLRVDASTCIRHGVREREITRSLRIEMILGATADDVRVYSALSD